MNKEFTIGIEEEYMLCDTDSLELSDFADKILSSLPQDFHSRFSYELLLSEIESNTDVCSSVEDAINDVCQKRNVLRELGDEIGYKIGISGTHPSSICENQSFVSSKSYNWVVEQLNYYAKRNVTFSTHVHISVPCKDSSIYITNAVRRWLPALLAISTNSPFFEGKITGMRSSRTFQFGAFPRTEIPPYIESYEKYTDVVDNLIDSNAITNPRQIWWKVRPNMSLGTVELRVCDAQRSLHNVKMITAISQALIHRCYQDYLEGKKCPNPSLIYLNDAIWKAARFDFDSLIYDEIENKSITIKEHVQELLNYIAHSLHFFNTESIVDIVRSILQDGTEGDKQLEIYKSNGMDGLKEFLINDVDYSI